MTALTTFLRLFPLTRVDVCDDELVYWFTSPVTAAYPEGIAMDIIFENGLPVVIEMGIWSSKGIERCRSLTVKMAPEEYEYADDVQDDELLSGGWWNKTEE